MTPGRKRVLVVEDDPLLAMDMEAWIEYRFNASVVLALTLSEAYAALDEKIDLTILDVNLADGQTFDLARLLKKTQIPFVFVCGHALADFPSDIRNAAYVGKPWTESILAPLVTAHL